MTASLQNGALHQSGEAPRLTGMAEAVLHEVADLLATFAQTGAPGAIDLTSIPLTREDRAELERRLGRGEVEATLAAAGRSELWETVYAGVWWVRHYGEGDKVATESIEITRCPQILSSHPDDMRAAVARLSQDLESFAFDVNASPDA